MREMKEIIITPITTSVTVSNKFAEAMTKKNIHKKLLPAITPIANFVGVTWKRIKKDNNKKSIIHIDRSGLINSSSQSNKHMSLTKMWSSCQSMQ